jgi:hypothetical protein
VGKAVRGVAIVQDPEEAKFPDMPRSALAHVDIEYVLRVSEMTAGVTGGPGRAHLPPVAVMAFPEGDPSFKSFSAAVLAR